MHYYGKCAYDAYFNTHNKTGPYNQAIDKIMDAVSYQIQISKGVDFAFPFMAMPPVEILSG